MQEKGHKPAQEEVSRGSRKRTHPSGEPGAGFPTGDSMEVKEVANDSGFGGHTRFEWAEGEGDFWQVGSYEDKFTAGNMRRILGRLSQVAPLP